VSREDSPAISALKQATICIAVDEPAEVAAFEAWISKWQNSFSFISSNEGCGCCVDIYRIEGPQEAFAELPQQLIAADAGWTSS